MCFRSIALLISIYFSRALLHLILFILFRRIFSCWISLCSFVLFRLFALLVIRWPKYAAYSIISIAVIEVIYVFLLIQSRSRNSPLTMLVETSIHPIYEISHRLQYAITIDSNIGVSIRRSWAPLLSIKQ